MTGGRSNSSLAALLLAQRLVETSAQPLKASEYWDLLESVGDPGQLMGRRAADVAELTAAHPEDADRLCRLLDAATAFAFQLDEIEQSGLRLISSIDDAYPAPLIERLGRSAPPMLYVAGDLNLLRTDLLGVVGSRDISEAGAEFARSAAEIATQHGVGVVSGAAKGVDRLAMGAALDAEGVAVGVLADSLVRMARDADIRRAITDGHLCLCTPYKPTTGFSVANAMARNKVIYGLSQATLVVAADHDKGGTWAGAVEALRHETAPVLVWSGDGGGSGNAALITRGGTAVESADDLFPLPVRAESASAVPSRQLSLDV